MCGGINMDKINLIYGKGDVLHTHLNINPFEEKADGKTIIRDDVMNIDKHADDAELTELIASDVLDYIPLVRVDEVLSNWIKKIRIGGKIVLGGVDMLEVSKSFADYRIDITEANLLIHGEQTKPYLCKKVSFTCMGLSQYIEQRFNLHILKKRVNNYKMIVEAERRQ